MKKLVSILVSIILSLVAMSMLLIGVGCGHTHKFSDEYKNDQTSHWKECSCGEKADVEKHKDSDNDNICNVCNYKMPVKSSTFDEDNIAFSFGAVSDVHVKKTMWESNVAQIYAAFDQLLAEAKKGDADGLDALSIAGDLISNTEKTEALAEEEITGFVNIVKEYKDSDFGTNVMLTCGNHDTRGKLPEYFDQYFLLVFSRHF